LSAKQLEIMQGLEEQAMLGTQALGGMSETVDAERWPDLLLDVLADSRKLLHEFAASTATAAEDQTELRGLRDRALELAHRCELFISDAQSSADEEVVPAVRWSSFNKSGFSLHHAPVDVAKPLSDLIRKQGGAWIFTSATLAVGTNLSHFASRVGLPTAEAKQFGSPFDYQRQALLYLPRKLDMPSTPQHTQQVVDAALPVITASGGRAFLLFTSYRALREAAQRLRALWGTAAPYPLLVQGEAPRDVLLQQFREFGNAVLLGTGSFWEGVDVKGHALCVVVIDKLPFAVPDEPLIKARLAAIEKRGGNPFMEEQVPQAVMTLKQGVGRLIRDRSDFGVIMLCDRRLTTRSYGKVFLDSLPSMPRTEDVNKVCQFLHHHLDALPVDTGAMS
jgi:ATP-dependent DNA helicase DinG